MKLRTYSEETRRLLGRNDLVIPRIRGVLLGEVWDLRKEGYLAAGVAGLLLLNGIRATMIC